MTQGFPSVRHHEIRHNERGVSLVEALFVIVVLGSLSGIVAFGVDAFRTDAAQSRCGAEAATVTVAATAYLARNSGTIPGSSDLSRMQSLVDAGYLEALPAAHANIGLAENGPVTDTCDQVP